MRLDTVIVTNITGNLPSVFAWCKAFHASGDGSIYQVLLGIVLRICIELVYE